MRLWQTAERLLKRRPVLRPAHAARWDVTPKTRLRPCGDIVTRSSPERFAQTILNEWAYAQRYPDNEARFDALGPWVDHYN